MYGYTKIAMAVPKVSLADVSGNLKDIKEKILKAQDEKADIVVFPELSLTGYSCGDLFFQSALLKESLLALKELCAFTESISSAVVVGLPLNIGGKLFDCGAVISKGKVLGFVPKTNVQVKGEKNEGRWFSSAKELTADFITEKELFLSESETKIPVGNDLVFSLDNEYKFSLEIGEDMFMAVTPGTVHSASGSELIINMGAFGEAIGRREYRKETVESLKQKLRESM